MKTIFKIIAVVLVTVFQNCKSQDAQRYIAQYEESVPKLNQLAKEKEKFYSRDFSMFTDELENKKIRIFNIGYDGKTANSSKIYVIRMWFNDIGAIDLVRKNKYQFPLVVITFKDEIPYEFRALTVKYEGKLSDEVRKFLANRKIEKIDFYGINGLTNTDRTAR